MANRIGGACIARQQESLAAASTEILLAPGTGLARLPHPVRIAECQERWRSAPDVGKRMLAHIPEFKAGNDFSGVAGKHPARRRNVPRTGGPDPPRRPWESAQGSPPPRH